jgi:hypothetical protein
MFKNYCFERCEKIYTEDGKKLLKVDISSSTDQLVVYWITLIGIIAVGIVVVFTG